MQKEILIIKNISREGPGLFENLIKEYCIKYKIIDLSLGEKIPPLNNYGAVVILGGLIVQTMKMKKLLVK